MTRSAARPPLPISCRRPNFVALLVALAAAAILYVNVDPLTAGADPEGAIELLDAASCPPPPPMPVMAASPGSATAQSGSVQNADVITGRWALIMQTMLLERGCASFRKVSDYTASLQKQERIDGKLGDVQILKVKLRHEPFSVYMKWQNYDKGRELIYVEGQNDGNMLIQPGGWKGRLTGTLSLDPAGRMAMTESRHPVTQAGLVRLAEKLLSYSHVIQKRDGGYVCELHANQTVQGRDCYLFMINYESPRENETYRKSIQYLDKELSLPIIVKNYTWGEDMDPETIDEHTLIESYTWSDIRVDQRLANGDFDQTNSSYGFRQR